MHYITHVICTITIIWVMYVIYIMLQMRVAANPQRQDWWHTCTPHHSSYGVSHTLTI